MFEFKGLIGSAAKNENAGFVTPRNKNPLSRKTLFVDKPKMALGDLKNYVATPSKKGMKNSLNVVTPMKNGMVEKTEQRGALFSPSSPAVKSSSAFNEATKSTPVPYCDTYDWMGEMEYWNQKQMLSEDQFELLFIRSPKTSPPAEVLPPLTPNTPESICDFTCCDSIWDSVMPERANLECDLPPINNSFSADEDFCTY